MFDNVSSNYDMYGTRPEDFIRGVIAGVTMFAVWKNGVQVVGIREEPLQKVVEEIRSDLEEEIL